ncbi:hypothetical protein BDZ97DRAFT_2072347, partial [Flammula alnicola]
MKSVSSANSWIHRESPPLTTNQSLQPTSFPRLRPKSPCELPSRPTSSVFNRNPREAPSPLGILRFHRYAPRPSKSHSTHSLTVQFPWHPCPSAQTTTDEECQ